MEVRVGVEVRDGVRQAMGVRDGVHQAKGVGDMFNRIMCLQKVCAVYVEASH